MSTPQNQTPSSENRKYSDINLKDLLDLHKENVLLSMNCHAIGTIQSFNSSNQTVEATINYKKTIQQSDGNGNYSPVLIDYPVLIDVPVIILSGGNGSLTFPIAQGDTCLILFNDRDIDNWFVSGQLGPLNSPRLHSFADGIALIGLRSAAKPLGSYDQTRVVLQNGSTLVGVGPSLVKIANQTTTLLTLLNQLITAIKGITTLNSDATTGAVSAASQATLSSIATSLGGLLE